MTPDPDPAAFAADWVAAWNSHDLERILTHYTEDVHFTSPTAARLLPDSQGVLRGKPALREYWSRGLAMLPDLHFTLEAVLGTVDGVTLLYRNERGQLVAETMLFDATSGLVARGIASYAAG